MTTCQVGDHIVLSALIHCGVCRSCLKGRPNLCSANLDLTFPGTDATDGALLAGASTIRCNDRASRPRVLHDGEDLDGLRLRHLSPHH